MSIPEEYLRQTVTTLCHCWRVVLRNGVETGFTDHDRTVFADGSAFEPEAGFSASEAKATLGLGIDSMEVEGAISSARITEADILAGLYDGATVETLLVDWTDPIRFQCIGQATIARIRRSDMNFVAELESVGRALDLVSGRYVRRGCDAELGDGRCGVPLAGAEFTASGEVVAVHGDRLLVGGLGGYAQGWFENGHLTWTFGARMGRRDPVTGFRHDADGTSLVLWTEGDSAVRAGDTFDIAAGCDKSFATCKAKFRNSLNFRGFPHLPGNDDAYAYVTETGAFDGGPLVP